MVELSGRHTHKCKVIGKKKQENLNGKRQPSVLFSASYPQDVALNYLFFNYLFFNYLFFNYLFFNYLYMCRFSAKELDSMCRFSAKGRAFNV